jgi:DNA-binding NarL/FixJ family response regulator
VTQVPTRTQRKPIRVAIADDHALFREGLRLLLELEKDVKVVAEIEFANDLAPTLSKTSCDILLLDLNMDRSVLGDIERLSRITKVIVLTGSERLDEMVAAFRSGARGIVRKTHASETLVKAMRAIAEGMIWMPPDVQSQLTAVESVGEVNPLSAREREVVRYVAVGFRNAEVARRLAISEGTVKVHLSNIFQKLNVRDRVELTLYALRSGLITIPDRVP